MKFYKCTFHILNCLHRCTMNYNTAIIDMEHKWIRGAFHTLVTTQNVKLPLWVVGCLSWKGVLWCYAVTTCILFPDIENNAKSYHREWLFQKQNDNLMLCIVTWVWIATLTSCKNASNRCQIGVFVQKVLKM